MREKECVFGMCSALSCSALFETGLSLNCLLASKPRDLPNFSCNLVRLQVSNHSGLFPWCWGSELRPLCECSFHSHLTSPKIHSLQVDVYVSYLLHPAPSLCSSLVSNVGCTEWKGKAFKNLPDQIHRHPLPHLVILLIWSQVLLSSSSFS